MSIAIEIVETEPLSEMTTHGIFWPDGPRVSSYLNVRTAVLALGHEFRFNKRARRFSIRWGGAAKSQSLGERQRSGLRQQIATTYGFTPAKEHLSDAIEQLCYENSFDPVRDYLRGLRWDKTPRLDRWLTTYFGVADTPLTRAIGAIVLTAAVRRARKPGCKFDEILVLVGPQGLGKSRAIRVLAKRSNWYSDQEILHLNAQQQQEALEGVWIYELSELGGLNRSSTEKVKAFASRTRDRARRAYGRTREDDLRRCIFIATTNEETFLRDDTGNRRFWPVAPTKIKLNDLKRDCDQLWAEAAAREKKKGVTLKLPKELWAAAAQLQEARLEDDPWIEQLRDLQGTQCREERRVSFAEVIERLNLGTSWQTGKNWKRVCACMTRLGWVRVVKPFKLGGRTVRGFSRPTS